MIPFDSLREVTHEHLQLNTRYRMAFSLDGGATFQVRNVMIELDDHGQRRVRWCDDYWNVYPSTNGADIGLLVDDLDESVRFEWVPSLADLLSAEHRGKMAEQSERRIDEINQSLQMAANVDSESCLEHPLAWFGRFTDGVPPCE